MSQKYYEDEPTSRRGFLKTALAATAGAMAASAGTYALTQSPTPETIIRTLPSPTLPQVAQAGGQVSNEIMDQLVASLAENMRLQAELNTAQQRISAMTAQNAQPDTVQLALESELENANLRIGALGGLVGLYEQLEDVEFDDVLDAGISTLSGSLSTLMGQIPTLDEALEAGSQALDTLEAQIPLVDNGRQWLDNHTSRLDLYQRSLEAVLHDAVENAGDFLQMLGDWFASVLTWLPFGMGDKASRVVSALTDLLGETPHTLSGLNTNVSQPLAMWVGDNVDGEKPLKANLVRPLREKAIAQAKSVASQTADLQTRYETNLAQPARNALHSRQSVRQMIATYRQQQNI